MNTQENKISTQHTPGPWTESKAYAGTIHGTRAGKQTAYAVAAAHGMTTAEQDANAEFIIRACNSHAELVAALEMAVERLDYTVSALARGTSVSIGSLQNCAAEACAAIAKSKGEAVT